MSIEATFKTTVGLASTGRVAVQKWNEVTSKWETLSNTADGGLLDLLGASGNSVAAAVEFTDPGNYRVFAEPLSVLELGTVVTLDANVITYNHDTIGGFGVLTATGSILEGGSIDSTTLVTEVNGQPVTAFEGKTTITGTYGSLAIDVYGNYVYTPNAAGEGIGKVEEFTYTIRNADGVTDTAKLYIRLDSPDMGLNWSADQSLPADIVVADDSGTAVVNSVHRVTPVDELLANGSTPIGSTGAGSTTASVEETFTISENQRVSVLFEAKSTNTGTSSVTLTITGDNGFSTVLTGSATAISESLDLEPGNYTVVADYTRTAAWWINETLTLTATAKQVAHLDQFEATPPEAVAGNIFDNDDIASSFFKMKIDDGTGDYIDVSTGTTVAGIHGALTLNADGSYSYLANPELAAIGEVDTFNYQLVHPNGDILDATLTISIQHGEGPYVPQMSVQTVNAEMFGLFDYSDSDAQIAEQDGDVDLDALGIPPADDTPIIPEAGPVESDPYYYTEPPSLDSDLEDQF